MSNTDQRESDVSRIGSIFRTISNTKKVKPAGTKTLPDSHDPDTEKAAIPQSISKSRQQG